MSQLDLTVPTQVLAAFDSIKVDGVKIRHYPDSYKDEVKGKLIKGPAAEVNISSSPILEYSSHYMKPSDIEDEAEGFIMVAGSGIELVPVKGHLIVGLDGDDVFTVLKVKTYKTGALVAAYECHLGR